MSFEGESGGLVCVGVCRSIIPIPISAHRRMRRGAGGGGAAALPNSGKTVGKIRAKQEEKIGQRKLKD